MFSTKKMKKSTYSTSPWTIIFLTKRLIVGWFTDTLLHVSGLYILKRILQQSLLMMHNINLCKTLACFLACYNKDWFHEFLFVTFELCLFMHVSITQGNFFASCERFSFTQLFPRVPEDSPPQSKSSLSVCLSRWLWCCRWNPQCPPQIYRRYMWRWQRPQDSFWFSLFSNRLCTCQSTLLQNHRAAV